MSTNYDDLTGAYDDSYFPGSDEYDIITSNELNLPLDKSIEAKTGDNASYADSEVEDLPNRPLSSVKHYEDEWNQLFSREELDIEELKQKSVAGELRTNRFRSICWRCLLGVLHKEPKQWIYQLRTYRKHYDDLRDELEKNPWNIKLSNPYDNPLSQESESIWQKYFSDEELKAVIHQDVIRTFPGVDFFRKDEIQDLMVRVLFCYARQNPALCYRQGMHEILAPLIFILHCDHQALLHAKEQNLTDGLITEILDPDKLEQDAYTIFKHIMNHIESSYRINNVIPTPAGYFPADGETCDKKTCENEVINRLEYIKENLLQPSDPDLTKHLDQLDIPLQLFGIRWLRLLFGREFPLQDLLVLWDAIFAESTLDLVNYIVVAMLIAIRHQLLAGDYTTCLTSLMRYPSGVDITFVIEHALHLKDPQKYPAPAVTSFPNLPVSTISKIRTNRLQSRPSSDSLDRNLKRNRRLKQVPSGPSQWLYPRPHPIVVSRNGDGDSDVVEGYALDDPHLLKAELEHAQAVMSLVRLKLNQYHTSLTNTLPYPISLESQHALDGIYELCCLLKSHQPNPEPPTPEIERADEAGEMKSPKPLSPPVNNPMITSEISKSAEKSINNDKAHTLPKMNKRPISGELKVFKQSNGEALTGLPMSDPLRMIKSFCYEDEDLYQLLKDMNKPNVIQKKKS